MDKESLIELAALRSLGALSQEELQELERSLAGDAELREYMREFDEVAASLAYVVPPQTVPPHLKANILSAIAEEQKIVKMPEASASRAASWFVPWALAASFAIFCGILAMWNQRISHEKELALTRETALEARLAEMQNARIDLEKQLAIASANAQLANIKLETLTSQVNASYLAAIAWDEKSQQGILHVQKLPSAESGKDYQLWVIDPKDPVPISAGVFTVESDGSAQIKFSPIRPVGSAKAFAISLEKSGGSPTSPAGPIVLAN